jgi:hypothetical protein
MDAEVPDTMESLEDIVRPSEAVLYRNILGTRIGSPVTEEELPW